MKARKKLVVLVATGVLAVGGVFGGMIAFLGKYQGPDLQAKTAPAGAVTPAPVVTSPPPAINIGGGEQGDNGGG